MSTIRVFWSTCPSCHGKFIVGWELRHGDHKLHCPFCGHRYLADESEEIDERA